MFENNWFSEGVRYDMELSTKKKQNPVENWENNNIVSN